MLKAFQRGGLPPVEEEIVLLHFFDEVQLQGGFCWI